MPTIQEITRQYNQIPDRRAHDYIGANWAAEMIDADHAYALTSDVLHPEQTSVRIAQRIVQLDELTIESDLVNTLRSKVIHYFDQKQDELSATGSVVYLVGSLSDGYIKNGDFDVVIVSTNENNALTERTAQRWQKELLREWPAGGEYGTVSLVHLDAFRTYVGLFATGTEKDIWDNAFEINKTFESLAAPLCGRVLLDPMALHDRVTREVFDAIEHLPIFAATISAELDAALEIRQERMRDFF